MSVELGNVEVCDRELADAASQGEAVVTAVEAVQPDFHVSPRMAAVSAGVLGVSALAFYIYGHLPGS